MQRHVARLGAAIILLLVVAGTMIRVPAWAQVAVQDHQLYTQTEIDAGSRLYGAQCAQCHGPNGDLVGGVDLRRGQFRRVSTDQDLARVITSGIPGSGMPPFTMHQSEVAAVVAYIRAGFDPSAGPVRIGNAARGQALFGGKAACNTCHRVNGIGPRVAPDLSDVGSARTPGALQAMLLDPSSRMMPINRPVRIVMRDDRNINGRRLNEDTYTVQLIDDNERLWSLAKADMRSYVVETASTMPSYATRLTPNELADLIAYLLTLKG